MKLKNDPDNGAGQVKAPKNSGASECLTCFKLTIRTCSKCGRDRYCSARCEEKRSGRHAFTYNIGRPITTADLLVQDIREDRLPSNPQVEEDFGFHRLYKFPDKMKLLGLYKGLYDYHDVSEETLHEWQVSKTVIENIIVTFSKIPEACRGDYYPWFLEHQYVLDGTMNYKKALEDLAKVYDAEARVYLSPSDKDKRLEDLQPWTKRSAFLLLKMAIQGSNPAPSESGPYYDFGFCTCTNEYTECLLGGLYQELFIGDKLQTFWTRRLPNYVRPRRELCTFEEFWRAYDAGKLIELMDKKRFKSDRERFKHLDTFLSYPPNGWHPSVWGLQTYLNESDKVDPPRPVYVDYGFVSCDDYFETMELKALYRTLLRSADHLELHEACIQGKLWSFATSHIQVDPRFESKMRNSYPLPFPYEYSGLQISRPLTVRFSQQQLESLSDNFLLSADGIIVDGGPGGGEKHVIRLPP